MVNSTYIDFQGEEFGTITDREVIREFNGVKYIKSLPRFPLKYHPNAASVAQRLLERGQRFACLSGQHYKIHRGMVPKKEYPDRYEQPDYGQESSSSEDDSVGAGDGRVLSRQNESSALQVLMSMLLHNLVKGS